jgi:gamma-glutamylputrescine oxidase
MGFLQTDEALARHCCYADTAPLPAPAPTLQGSEEADVAVVGGGLAGLSAAIELAQRGLRVSLLEARRIGWGPSGRNGGQVIAGLACDMPTIEAQLGHTAARAVWDGTLEAIDIIHQRCAQHGIDAQWQPGYINVAVNARKGRALQHSVARMAERYGHLQRWIPPEQMRQWVDSPAYHSGAYDARSGHLHPRKYTLGLARAARALGVRLRENSAVQRLHRGSVNRLVTADGELRARQVVLAGNVYLQGVAPALSARIMPVGTYILATEPIAPERLNALIPTRSAVCDTNFVLDYFRPDADHRLLYGGRVSHSTQTPAQLAQQLHARLVSRFPTLADCRPSHLWGGFVDITMNRAPDFGRLPGAAGAPATVYYLQGFSGHGVALSGLAGRLVAQAVAGDAGRFDVFARLRHRPFPGGRWLRAPALVAGMAWYQLRDLLG